MVLFINMEYTYLYFFYDISNIPIHNMILETCVDGWREQWTLVRYTDSKLTLDCKTVNICHSSSGYN